MSYIGVPPQATFSSGLLDRFTSTTGTTVTLTHDIASENDIVVFVNFVKQDSTTYSVGGTGNKTLTLGGTLVSSDIVEVHYLNIVGQTINPSANSVGSSQLTADSITGQAAETSIATDDTILIHDTSASALKKMTRANFVSGIGGANSDLFYIYKTSNQSISDSTTTVINWETEVFDTGSDFASNTYTVPSDGYYLFHLQVMLGSNPAGSRHFGKIVKTSGTAIELGYSQVTNAQFDTTSSTSLSYRSAGDTIQFQFYQNTGGSVNLYGSDPGNTYAFGYRLNT